MSTLFSYIESTAQDYLDPLLKAYGYKRVQVPEGVRYTSDAAVIDLLYDPYSKELSLTISPRGSDKSFPLEVILNTLRPNQQHHFAVLQASTPARIVVCIKGLADILAQVAGPVLSGDTRWFDRMEATMREMSARTTSHCATTVFRQEAELAWQKKDYAQVIALYEQLEGQISEVESRRLLWARKQEGSRQY